MVVGGLSLTEHQPGTDSSDTVTTPPTTTLGGRGEDPDFTETEAPGATELLNGEAQAFGHFKQQLSDPFSYLIFSRGLRAEQRSGCYPYFKYEENRLRDTQGFH